MKKVKNISNRNRRKTVRLHASIRAAKRRRNRLSAHGKKR
jgi:hypothetical protein